MIKSATKRYVPCRMFKTDLLFDNFTLWKEHETIESCNFHITGLKTEEEIIEKPTEKFEIFCI